MDKNMEKKPRTIKMKYPAPYSQSWTENQNTGVVKKRSKIHNTNQNLVPSHSQPWATDRNMKRLKRKPPSPRGVTEKKIVNPKKTTVHVRPTEKLSADPFSGAPWHPAKPKFRGHDPTAPHLKYGLFPPPKKNSNKSQIQLMSASAPEPKSRTSTPEHSSRKEKKIKKGQPIEGEAPSLLRPTDKHYKRSHQLSVSTPTHVDIRPRTKAGAYAPVTSQSHASGRVPSKIKNNAPTLNILPL